MSSATLEIDPIKANVSLNELNLNSFVILVESLDGDQVS